MKKAIRKNILYGAKVIKIVTDDQPYVYSTEDIRFIVEETAAAGLKVAAESILAADRSRPWLVGGDGCNAANLPSPSSR